MKFSKVVLGLGLLTIGGLGLNGPAVQAAADGDTTAQFQLDGPAQAPLRLESVPQFEFQRVPLSHVINTTTISTPHTVVSSVVKDDRGHLVVADERTAAAREAGGWQVNAQLNVVALADSERQLSNVEMLVDFGGHSGSAIINGQASPVWQNQPAAADPQQVFSRDAVKGRLLIPQQRNDTLAGKYSAHVTWTLTDSIDMQEVTPS